MMRIVFVFYFSDVAISDNKDVYIATSETDPHMIGDPVMSPQTESDLK
jgi:hypothetical protein